MRESRKERAATSDPYTSVAHAARVLGISRPTVHARVSAGLLVAAQSAGRTVITIESLMKLAAEQGAKPSAAEVATV